MPWGSHIKCMASKPMETVKQLIRNVSLLALSMAYLSSPLLLGCPIKGHPTPNITWFHGDQPVANTTGLTHHILAAGRILRVANLSGGSQGEFSCLAQNEAGMLVQKASLVIQGKKPFRRWVPGLFLEEESLLGNLILQQNKVISDLQWFLEHANGSPTVLPYGEALQKSHPPPSQQNPEKSVLLS